VAPVSRSKLLLIDENLFFQIGVIDEIDVFVEDAKVRDWPIAAGGVAQERKRNAIVATAEEDQDLASARAGRNLHDCIVA
jgi:hypothetical protein